MPPLSVIAALLLLPVGLAQMPPPARALVLDYRLDPKDRGYLDHIAHGCVSLEVQFSAELRKVRLLWPDLSYTTTVIRNRLTCDATTRHRTLLRLMSGAQIATLDEPDESAVVPFLADIGQSPLFEAHHFSPTTARYSVRIDARLIAPDGEYHLLSNSVPVTLP